MPESKPKRRWYHITPDRLIFGLVAVEGLLFLSEWFQWFAFNEKKGWTVLIAMAAVCLVVVVMLPWLAASLLFRWRFQFSLRSLVVLVVAVAVPLGWFGVKMREAERQRRAVVAVERAGGWVEYHQMDEFLQMTGRQEPPAPAWLMKLVGVDFFADIAVVSLSSTAVGNETMEHLSVLTKLEVLLLGDTNVSDLGLEHLTSMTKLEVLSLADTNVSDLGLEHLKGMTKLTRLTLSETQITDLGLKHLGGMTSLLNLSLYCTHVSDVGLKHLKGLANLHYVDVSDTQVTVEGIKDLREALPSCAIYIGAQPRAIFDAFYRNTTHDQP